MSPASSGNLEVEHYIGACLISQNRFKKNNRFLQPGTVDLYHHQQHQQVQQQVPQHHPHQHLHQYHQNFQNYQKCNGPLIYNNQTPNGIRGRDLKGKLDDQRSNASPLARLAVHTQGAPLILTKPTNYRKKSVRNNNNNSKSFDQQVNNKSKTIIAKNDLTSASSGADTVSVASDESTGSANSENCLPRIIKPRKRRKKDRKPPPALNRPLSQDGGFSTDNSSASPDIDNVSSPPTLIENLNFNFDAYPYRTTNNYIHNKTHNIGAVEEAPNLHHSFDDVEEVADINGNQTAISCQCRYCDPSGQIWDMDRNCYSPFLTRPQFHYVGAGAQSLTDGHSYSAPISRFDSRCLEHSMSSVSLESNDENSSVRKMGGGSGDLEVSTEIVTSLNGHRDLEIKFFSIASLTSSSSTNSDNNNNNSDSSKNFSFLSSRNEE